MTLWRRMSIWQISEQVRSRLEQLPGIRTAHVNIVCSAAWTPAAQHGRA
jgi:metal-sulfur cluster biosynthetic enzyme